MPTRMTPSRIGYWALVSSAVVVAAIGVMLVAWGVKVNAQLASAFADRLIVGGVVFIAAGGYATRWLLERGQ